MKSHCFPHFIRLLFSLKFFIFFSGFELPEFFIFIDWHYDFFGLFFWWHSHLIIFVRLDFSFQHILSFFQWSAKPPRIYFDRSMEICCELCWVHMSNQPSLYIFFFFDKFLDIIQSHDFVDKLPDKHSKRLEFHLSGNLLLSLLRIGSLVQLGSWLCFAFCQFFQSIFDSLFSNLIERSHFGSKESII